MTTEAERFDVNHPLLCPHLRWKGMFIGVEHDPTAPSMSSGHFWCVYTHNCLGPDRELAEPGTCSSPERACHGKGTVNQ
jgi:hypothetical protein